MRKHKIVLIQRVITHYRVRLFQRLSNIESIDLTLYYGASGKSKSNKANNSDNIEGFKNRKLLTLCCRFRLHGKLFPIFFHPAIIFHLFKDRPDLIICEGESNLINNVFVVLFAKITNTPYVWWGLGRVRSNKPSILRKILGPIIKHMLKNASAILGYSTFAKEFYSSYGINKDKIFVAYNCVDTDKVKADIEKYNKLAPEVKKELGLDYKKVILFVGSFMKEKKIENLILAYQKIKKDYPDTALLLVGDGEMKKGMENLVQGKHLNDVVFIGKTIEDVSLYFLIGDLFVLPGEGGLAINQAMTHELPVVTVPADGTELDMVINGKNGYIVNNDDIDALIESIIKILRNDTLRQKMAQNSRILIEEQFNIKNMIDSIIHCIEYCI